VNTPTFNTISQILEQDFRLARGHIAPERTLVELGLDSLSLMEFVFAVEDAFRLRIPEDRLDPRAVGLTLAHLCDVIDGMTGTVLPATGAIARAAHA